MDQDSPDASFPMPELASRRVDAILLSVWRRLVREGCGPELTIAETAAVLDMSVETVRRRIAAGQIPAYRDLKGRLRIMPRLAEASDDLGPAVEQASLHVVSRMVEDLKSARSHIQRIVQENQALQSELQSASLALEHSREEIASMWRILSTRRPVGPGLKVRAPGGGKGVEKIQGKITIARQLASRRRKWPWAMVG